MPIAVGLLTAQAFFIALDRLVTLPFLAFYFASVLVITWLLTFVPLQPMRSKLALAGTLSKPGFQPGDFGRAVGVLPVRPDFVLRNVFVYSLVTTGAIWFIAMGIIAMSALVDAGVFGLYDSAGDPIARLVLPSVAMIPAVASLAVCSVHGHRRRALVSGLAIVSLPILGLVLQTNDVSAQFVALAALTVAAIGVAPAVRLLRS